MVPHPKRFHWMTKSLKTNAVLLLMNSVECFRFKDLFCHQCFSKECILTPVRHQ